MNNKYLTFNDKIESFLVFKVLLGTETFIFGIELILLEQKIVLKNLEESLIMKEEMKKMIKKSKLTDDELKEYLEMTANTDRKLDHSRAYRTLMNEHRRELLKFIGCDVRKLAEIKNEFKMEEDQLNYHLSMLKQCLYVIESFEGWKSTPRGLGFLENARLGD